MRIRFFTWQVWIGFLLCVVALLSYPLFFCSVSGDARLPVGESYSLLCGYCISNRWPETRIRSRGHTATENPRFRSNHAQPFDLWTVLLCRVHISAAASAFQCGSAGWPESSRIQSPGHSRPNRYPL